jgi:hypothetical protein
MVARVARFEGMDMAKAQETMGEAEAIIRPIVEGMPGFAGRMDFAGDGEFISITLFDSAADAAAAPISARSASLRRALAGDMPPARRPL